MWAIALIYHPQSKFRNVSFPERKKTIEEEEREILIKAEMKRIKKITADMDPAKLQIIAGLLQDAAFMAVTLQEVRGITIRDGVIEVYQNGENQRGRKKSSAIEVYDRMVNTYAKVVRQICEEMPSGARTDAANDIMKFALGGKK